MKQEKCPDCLANYTKNVNHTCSPWLKELVKRYNKKNKGVAEIIETKLNE